MRSVPSFILLVFSAQLFWMAQLPVLGQDQVPGKKPVLIRVDPDKEDPEEGPVLPDPEQARENVKVGDFYFKRDNYRAAEHRYRDAVKYAPRWAEPYEKLIHALEKQNELEKAIEVCQLFADNNPSAEEVSRFSDLQQKLKGKLKN
ncbi:MAG: tetratricopeptide repeat protein [Acidobacteriota bacterium]